MMLRLILCLGIVLASVEGWISRAVSRANALTNTLHNKNAIVRLLAAPDKDDAEEEWSDFADMGYTPAENPMKMAMDEDRASMTEEEDLNEKLRLEMERRKKSVDYTAIQTRQFSLGKDLIVTNYVGDMGFDEVTDWQYYYQDEDEEGRRQGDRKVVQPNPFDSTKPRRTRVSSGSVLRIFRGEFIGTLGGSVSAQGLDRRVLIKEFSGKLALELARNELQSLGRMQSTLVGERFEDAKLGEWIRAANTRYVSGREDNSNLVSLQMTLAKHATFVGAFGEVNLAELDFEANEFYQAFSVAPPKPDAVWLVYEYAGLSTIQAYCMPAETRRARLPPKRGLFGKPVPPPKLAPFKERAKFVVQGIIKKAAQALIAMHNDGVVHRSIGRTSFVLTTPAMDKREAISVYNTRVDSLTVKISDLGFSGRSDEAANDEEFCVRARSFGLSFRKGTNTFETMNFAVAEDIFALGFVFIGLLLTSLAEVEDPNQSIPATDEDSLQRLIGEIFDKDFAEFREYVKAEDAWSSLVKLLDEDDRAGWKFLEELLLCREKVARLSNSGVPMTSYYLKNLLSGPFLAS